MSPLATPHEPFRHADLDGRPRHESTLAHRPGRSAPEGPAALAIAAVRRAWSSDDKGDFEAARKARAEAAWFLRMAIRDGSQLSGHVSADFALLADLLRRSGDRRGATAVARRGLDAAPPEGVGSLLLFQLELSRAGDEGRHDIGEALAASA